MLYCKYHSPHESLKIQMYFLWNLKISLKFEHLAHIFVELQVLGQGLGVDFIFAWDNNNNKNDKNPHLNFLEQY